MLCIKFVQKYATNFSFQYDKLKNYFTETKIEKPIYRTKICPNV